MGVRKKGDKSCSTLPQVSHGKREKLNYMRQSVACGEHSFARHVQCCMCHQSLECTILTVVLVPCRQRKIRCKLQDGDLQVRCEYCSKRNKECVFCPVDQHKGVASGTHSRGVGVAFVTSVKDTPSPPRSIAAMPPKDVDYRGQVLSLAPLIMTTTYSSLLYESGHAPLEQEVLPPVIRTPNPPGWEADKLHIFGIDCMNDKTR